MMTRIYKGARGWCTVLAAAVIVAGLMGGSQAQNRSSGGASGDRRALKSKAAKSMKPDRPYDEYERTGLFDVGLKAVYPAAASCLEIASPFGSKTRYDGSTRRNDHYGYHGGFDISMAEGTPLIAIAAGEVIHGGTGGQLEGNFIWLRHTPEDTGLSVYIYAKYQHLDRPPTLGPGERVGVGQVLGPSGKTGTVGGYYGQKGYPHLHLTIYVSDVPDYGIRDGKVMAVEGRMLDPLGLYIGKPGGSLDNHVLRALADADKKVILPYQTVDGVRTPVDSRLVWPVACTLR